MANGIMKYGLLQDNMSCFTSDLCGGTARNGTKVRKIAHFLKKYLISFGGFKKTVYLCIAIKKNGPVAQLNRASDYGSEGYRFESCRGHKAVEHRFRRFFVFIISKG